MKKNWIQFLVFWMVFAILFAALNLAFKSGNEKWSYFYHLPKDSVDVIFIGNSHNFTAFQPEIIEAIIPVDSYVLGIDAENVIISYYELKEVLRTQHPRVVVLETYTLDIDDTQKMGFIYEFIDAGLWNANKLVVAARYLSPEDAYSIFPALRKRLDWENMASYFSEFWRQMTYLVSPTKDTNQGAQIRTHAMVDTGEAVESAPSEKDYRDPSPDIEIYLSKMYQLCLENNIQLVLATSPVLTERMVENEFYAPYDESEFVKANDIPVITFSEDQFNLLHFYNPTHVNMMGSTIVSVQTAQELADIMDLSINQSALEYYTSYFFSSYSLINDDNHYLFTLEPVEQQAALEYQWKLFDTLTGQTLILSDWSEDSTAEFEIESDSNLIYLVYEIRNPDGEDSVGVSFPLKNE